MNKPRTELGTFKEKPIAEKRGDAIALRLPASLDATVRDAVDAEGVALRDWVESACRQKAEGRGQKAEGYTPEQIRAAMNDVAMAIRAGSRAPILRAFKALMGELLAGD